MQIDSGNSCRLSWPPMLANTTSVFSRSMSIASRHQPSSGGGVPPFAPLSPGCTWCSRMRRPSTSIVPQWPAIWHPLPGTNERLRRMFEMQTQRWATSICVSLVRRRGALSWWYTSCFSSSSSHCCLRLSSTRPSSSPLASPAISLSHSLTVAAAGADTSTTGAALSMSGSTGSVFISVRHPSLFTPAGALCEGVSAAALSHGVEAGVSSSSSSFFTAGGAGVSSAVAGGARRLHRRKKRLRWKARLRLSLMCVRTCIVVSPWPRCQSRPELSKPTNTSHAFASQTVSASADVSSTLTSVPARVFSVKLSGASSRDASGASNGVAGASSSRSPSVATVGRPEPLSGEAAGEISRSVKSLPNSSMRQCRKCSSNVSSRPGMCCRPK